MGIVTFVTMSLGGWGDEGFHRGILFILLFKETKILTALSSPYQNITCRRSPIPIAGAHMLEVERGVPKATATSVEHEGAGRHLIHQLWYFFSRPSSVQTHDTGWGLGIGSQGCYHLCSRPSCAIGSYLGYSCTFGGARQRYCLH